MIVIKPCKTRATFEASLDKPQKLKLELLADKLKQKGYSITVVTPHILVVEKEYEFSIFSSGKILVKKLKDEKLFRTYAQDIFGLAGVKA